MTSHKQRRPGRASGTAQQGHQGGDDHHHDSDPLLAWATSRLNAALSTIPHDQHDHPQACPHLPSTGGQPAAAIVCLQHPRRLDCLDCAPSHAAGHGIELEHTCDRCDRVVDPIYGLLPPQAIGAISNPDGQPATVVAFAVGLGLCTACLQQLQRGAA